MRSVESRPQPAEVHLIVPKSFNDAQQIADKFKGTIPVILNLQSAETDLAKRLIDFSSGLTYALDGGMQRVADKVFMLTPRNVEVSAEESAPACWRRASSTNTDACRAWPASIGARRARRDGSRDGGRTGAGARTLASRRSDRRTRFRAAAQAAVADTGRPRGLGRRPAACDLVRGGQAEGRRGAALTQIADAA